MRHSYFLLILLLNLNLLGQTTVHRKVAQRHDEYSNASWQGIDSLLFNYSNVAILTQQTALKANANSWDNFYRYTFTLTPNGNINAQLRENWTAGNWVNNTRYLYSYDAADNQTETLYDTWNGSTWLPNGKIETTGYNAFGAWTLQVTSIYNTGWQNLSRINQTIISGTNKVESRSKENWNTGTFTWDKFERLFYTYYQDSIGTIIRSLPDTNNNWKSANKYIYTYTGSPLQLQSYYSQYYNADSVKFIDTTRVLNTYNGNNNLEQILEEKHLGFSNWTTLSKTLFYYNASLQPIEKTLEEYSNTWQYKDRYTYTYTGNLKNEELYYQGNGNAWNLHHKTQFDYDVHDNLIFKQRDDFNGSNYIPLNRDFYYYNSFVVGLQDPFHSSAHIHLYPNPAHQQLTLTIDTEPGTRFTLTIYDASGQARIIRQEPAIDHKLQTQLPIQTLAPGTYILKTYNHHTKQSHHTKFQVIK